MIFFDFSSHNKNQNYEIKIFEFNYLMGIIARTIFSTDFLIQIIAIINSNMITNKTVRRVQHFISYFLIIRIY